MIQDEFLYRWLEDALIDPGLESTNIAKKYLRLRLFDEEESWEERKVEERIQVN